MKFTRLFGLLISFQLFLVLGSACSWVIPNSPTDSQIVIPKAEVVFQVTVPEPLTLESTIILEILDDVTGLYFNSSRFEMAKKDDLNYYIRIPLSISSEVKYRYLRSGVNYEYEFNSQNEQVRFRILRVDGPQVIEDSITTWIGRPFSGNQGRITGQVIDKENNAPIPNLLISAGGLQTITASDGSFRLEGLLTGVQNLVIYSMDGAYETFQQGALIADGATTPVLIYLNKRPVQDVVFTVTVPPTIDSTLPVRFVSNLQSLGNAYSDLAGGSAGSSGNYPEMTKTSKNQYSITLSLPLGAYLKYKYSLGDGFWNAELNSDGKFVVRELIIDHISSYENKIETFRVKDFAPVEFLVQTSLPLPAGEQVSIQLNPFAWMEPIPMVNIKDNNWNYTIYNPIHLLGPVEYRFCRNSDCELSTGILTGIQSFIASNQDQTVTATIPTWSAYLVESNQPSIGTEGGASQPKTDFIAGVELTTDFPTTWKTTIDQGLGASYGLGGDWVILTPTWTASQIVNPLLQPVPGRDWLWNDLQIATSHVLLNKQIPVIFPMINYAQNMEIFWSQSSKDDQWWNTWYEQYQRFIFNYADLANILDIPAIILGDPSVTQNMKPEDAYTPEDADDRWRQLISEVRGRYSGKIIGVATVDSDTSNFPAWLDSVDSIYVLFSPRVSNAVESDIAQLVVQFNSLLNEKVKSITDNYQKPLIIGISYPSNSLAADGYSASSLARTTNPLSVAGMDTELDFQSKIYNAAILSISSQDWVSGFIARGYYPYVSLQDASSTIYDKPAADVLWFWFHFLLSKTP